MQNLTGGTLLSRNKDYIVFYRGNDFLPPVVVEALKEREKLTDVQANEEDQARQRASAAIESKLKASKSPLVAGTLTETLAATSRWGNEISSKDVEQMRRDESLNKHAALLKYLEKKLALVSYEIEQTYAIKFCSISLIIYHIFHLFYPLLSRLKGRSKGLRKL